MPSIYVSDPRAREKPCLRCGLSLRKLFDVTHCPQCGLSIWLSLSDNDSLEWSKPPWLLRLAAASVMLAGSEFIGLAALALAVLPLGEPRIFNTLAALAAGVYLIVYHAALVLATTHEERYPDRIKVRRVCAQVVSAIAMTAGLALIFAALTGAFAHNPPPPQTMTMPDGQVMQVPVPEQHLFLGLALRGLFLLSSLATWFYFQRLARRLHNPTVRKICTILLFGPLVGLLKYSGIFIGFYLISMFAWVIDYLPWIYLPVTIYTFLRLAKEFRHASKSAAESWAKETVMASAQTSMEVRKS